MTQTSSARERVFDTAERLFAELGYKTVTMRDIADALGIKQASLYYHAPKGKEQLFTEVLERSLTRHREGLEGAIAQAAPHAEAQLRAVVHWFLAQPPTNFVQMLRTDMSRLPEGEADRLWNLSHASVFVPLMTMFAAGQRRGELRPADTGVLTGTLLSIINGLAFIGDAERGGRGKHHAPPLELLTEQVIDLFLYGIKAKAPQPTEH